MMPRPSATRGETENLLNAFGLGFIDENSVNRSIRQGYSTPTEPQMTTFIRETYGQLRSLEKLDIRFVLDVLQDGIVPRHHRSVFRSLEVDREAASDRIVMVHEVKPEIFTIA